MSELWYEQNDYSISVDSQDYSCYVFAKAIFNYHPGKLYMRNGDPGYPDDEDFEITNVDVEAHQNGEKIEGDKLEKIKEAISDELYEMDYDKWNEYGFED